MSSKNSLIFVFLLCLVGACSRDETCRGDKQYIEESTAQGGLRTRLMFGDDSRQSSSMCTQSKSPSVESVKQVVYAPKTVRAARLVVTEQINRCLAQGRFEDRLRKMRELAEIVSDWPVDESSPSNRANSHHLRFKMELEVFDGFVKLGKMEDAWRVVLSSIVAYREVMQKARIRADESVKRYEKSSGGMDVRMEMNKCLEYCRCVENDYQCAIHLIRDNLVPNVRFKFGIPASVERVIKKIIEDASFDISRCHR